jgi:hypothetical protein
MNNLLHKILPPCGIQARNCILFTSGNIEYLFTIYINERIQRESKSIARLLIKNL